MSMATLERAILAAAKEVLNNPKLRMKGIMEWGTGDIEPEAGEIKIFLPDPGVNVCVLKTADKRKP